MADRSGLIHEAVSVAVPGAQPSARSLSLILVRPLPAGFDARLRAIRRRRLNTRFAGAASVAFWITGMAALLTVGGGALLNLRW